MRNNRHRGELWRANPVSAVIRDAVSALENAGAIVEEVKLGIHRSSEELGNLHHRSMMPLYLPAFEGFKKNGIDLLRDHRQDFPLELLNWVEGFKQLTYTLQNLHQNPSKMPNCRMRSATRRDPSEGPCDAACGGRRNASSAKQLTMAGLHFRRKIDRLGRRGMLAFRRILTAWRHDVRNRCGRRH